MEATFKRQSALGTLLDQMDVPEMRRDTSQISNVRWLSRNLGINNREHAMFATAMSLVKWLLKHGWIDTSHIGA
tara:strand:- start:158 stop:379 length:222 start_codon:yes stop_codon:yes gene_type:complete